jgi:hypothetical protein
MLAEKRPHEWRGGVLGVLRLAPSAHISQINQKVIKGYNLYHIKAFFHFRGSDELALMAFFRVLRFVQRNFIDYQQSII